MNGVGKIAKLPSDRRIVPIDAGDGGMAAVTEDARQRPEHDHRDGSSTCVDSAVLGDGRGRDRQDP